MKQLLLILSAATIISSCQKATGPVPNMSLNVVNASPGVSNAKLQTPNATGFFTQLSGVNYGSNLVFTIPVGGTVNVFSSADTTHSLYSNTFTTGTLYSLFVGGASGGDMVLNQDTIPYRADSSFGVRFVNMSYNSSPVNVSLSTSTTTNEFSSIAYKSVTGFKSYSVKSTDPGSFSFQVRDGSGNLFTPSATISLSASTYRFLNVTLVLKGSYPAGLSVFTVSNF